MPVEEAIATRSALVGVDGLLDPGDARVGGERRALDRERQLGDLRRRPLGRSRGRVSPSIAAASPPGAGRAGELVLVGDARRLDRAGGDRGDARLAEVGAVGVADPAADPGAHADAALGRRGEALDLAAVDADLAPALLGGVGLGVAGAGGERRLDRARFGRGRSNLASRPTVIAAIRTWPWPVPTGTFWPPLPQKPVFISKSLPTASIAASASRQLPIRVAPRQGRVTLPPSIR